ncbi:MAG TPA: Hpt domain-containing protein, partial [Bradyrhizobium sp.]|nr:Hpt domain-containing protein [Bradyrhizobium sp.]
MNEFVEQFLLESRDLVAQATDDLLALEETPGDKDRLDGAFRAFHTLKGAAGIVDFAAMARALHAAEDILATIRSSKGAIAPNVLSECLTCLDLTSRWLDSMGTTGEAPAAAEAEADDMIARFAGALDAGEKDQVTPHGGDGWLERLRIDPGAQFGGPRTAVRYIPDQDAFFRGQDPMAIMTALPHLLSVDLALTDPAISLDSMNTFGCNLDIVALTGARVADVVAAL